MILTRLTLHNVGAYRGVHSIELAPGPSKPIVLVGALNGSGKTTLLESVQLALYGRSTRHLMQDGKGYAEYLKSLINKDINPRDGASVNLEFIHRTAGRSTQFSVLRTWSVVGSALREDLQIRRDGQLDSAMSERWIEFVSALLPVQIADLFLFDGERIEALARPDTSADLLRTGVHALLGLDLVDNLSRSLSQLERRLQRNSANAEDQIKLTELEELVEGLEARRQEFVTSEAALQNEIDKAEAALNSAREHLRAEGGELVNNREAIAREIDDRRRDLESVETDLRDLAGGATPLQLVSALVAEAAQWIDASGDARTDQLIRDRLSAKRKRMITLLTKQGLDRSSAEALLESLAGELALHSGGPGNQKWTALLAELGGGVLDTPVEELSELANQGAGRWEEAVERLVLAEQKLAAVPAEGRVEHLVGAVADAETHLLSASRRREDVVRERESVERELAKLREHLEGAYKTRRDIDRISVHSGRSREVLAAFRLAVAARKLHALEQQIAANFRRLLHKIDLVGEVRIDPDSYQLTVIGSNGAPIPPDRLSAGERQLLAVAVLWSLGQAAGRQLPVIIDTPLGRLDSVHRGHLVDNYFPHASDQVILLSTDEEVRGQYYDRLQPFVNRQYLITHCEKERTSVFEEGYFSSVEAAA